MSDLEIDRTICPRCGEKYEIACKCAAFVHNGNPIEMMNNGHGYKCSNHHSWIWKDGNYTSISTKNYDLPSIFRGTAYRIPTEEEFKEIDSYNLKAHDIVDGFCYTIIGKGINSQKNIETIIKCVKMLSDMFPENEEYKKAIKLSKEIKSK